jgi:hypothetical protein
MAHAADSSHAPLPQHAAGAPVKSRGGSVRQGTHLVLVQYDLREPCILRGNTQYIRRKDTPYIRLVRRASVRRGSLHLHDTHMGGSHVEHV